MKRTCLGFRVHSGWTAVVAVAAGQVVERGRIELADPAIAGSKQPYHAAEPLPLAEARELVESCRARSADLAREGLERTVAVLGSKGFAVEACVVVTASGRPLPALPAILASHAMIHTAEGEFFRDVVGQAAAALGLLVTKVKERELKARADFAARVTQLGRGLGPPWREDEKLSALAAWLVLQPDRATA